MVPCPQITDVMSQGLDFTRMMDELPTGVLIMDIHRRVVFLNRSFQALSGFSPSMARGVPCYHILRGGACISSCPVLAMKNEPRSIVKETDMINLDRQQLPIRMNTAPLFAEDGRVVGYIETIEDIRSSQKPGRAVGEAYTFSNIVGRSPQMEKIFQTLPILAQSDASVLITGETGTGKDLVAEAIHQTSEREAGPFIKINCGALPETLLESEIFGHQKGAFTGAVENKPGRFKLAHNGSIFLTEIGDLPLPLQVKLLTFLDDKVIFPLGSTKGFKANVRIIAATHRNLEQMVEQGRFRKDLMFRLNVARIHLPPLREREGDVRLLIDHFLVFYSRQLDKKINGLSDEALAILINYPYEGNIRELKNIVEYAVNVTTEPLIHPRHLPSYLLETATSEAPDFPKPVSVQAQNSPDIAGESSLGTPPPAHHTWTDVQKDMIMNALRKARGRKGEAAKLLGWGRSTLWRKMKQLKLDE